MALGVGQPRCGAVGMWRIEARETASPPKTRLGSGSGSGGLAAEADRADGGGVGVEHELVEAVVEPHVDTSRVEHLVQRREHDLAHPGLHLPEDRALEVEEQPAGEEQPEAGREAGSVPMAALVGEDQVVEAADEGGVERGRVHPAVQPFAEVEVVDAGEALASEQTVGDGPLDAAQREVRQLQQAAAGRAPDEVSTEHRPNLVELAEHGGDGGVVLDIGDAAERGEALDGDDQRGDLHLAKQPAQAAQRPERIGRRAGRVPGGSASR